MSEFRYLGLLFSGSPHLRGMAEARLVAVRKAWGRLMGFLVSRGWRDRATRLLLFEVFVRSCLLYGAGVWGVALLPASGSLREDMTGQFGVFYRRCLRALLGVHGHLRSEIVYVLSARLPLQLYVAKVVVRMESHIR